MINYEKQKKLLSSLLAASMLASAFPALAAYSTSKFDEATIDCRVT